jgi:hypothetical protein
MPVTKETVVIPINDVTRELIAEQRAIRRRKNLPPWGDDVEVAVHIMLHFRMCIVCRRDIGFNPTQMVEQCKNRKEFIYQYGLALTAHFADHPACRVKVEGTIDADDHYDLAKKMDEWRKEGYE